MSLISDFVVDLKATLAALTPAIEVPIGAIIAKPGADGEAIGVTISDDFSDLGFGNCRLNKTTTIQVDVYAGNYLRLMAMKDAVIDRYNGLTEVIGTTDFKKLSVVFSAESASTLNNTVYRVIINLEAKT